VGTSATSGSGGGSGGAGGGAAVGGSGGGGGMMPCGGLGALADNFDDPGTPLDFSWFPNQIQDLVKEGGGRLELDLTKSSSVNLQSRHMYRLAGSAVRIEVLDGGQDANAAPQLSFELFITQNSRVRFSLYQKMLTASASGNGQTYNAPSKAYDPKAHKWWQIREGAGTVYFEVSPDGTNWTAFGSTTSSVPADLEAARVTISASTFQMMPTNAKIKLDNLNGGMKTESLCKASSLSDAFTDSSKLVHWKDSLTSPGCMRTIAGELVFTCDGTQLSGNALESSQAFDLTGSYAGVQLVDVSLSPPTNAGGGLMVRRDRDNFLRIRRQGGQVRMEQTTVANGADSSMKDFDANAHKWLRIREAGGQIFFEASPNGTMYTVLFQTPAKLPVNEMDVLISTDSLVTGVQGTVKFDNYNLP
jgi:hypothetical protein